jgi:CubicO group peptidase (beta-lactamase class C family)
MAFPGKDWGERTPESQGLDPAKLREAAAYLEQNAGPDGVKELVIIRNGCLVWKGPSSDKVHGVWSVTKSFTSTVLGLLVEDGKCRLDTPAKEHLPALAERYPEVTLRHFTTMTSGYRAVGDEPAGSYIHGPSSTPLNPSPDPLFSPPGSAYAYWDSAMNQFAHVLTRIAGEPLEDLFERRIARPIGMDRSRWDWGDLGRVDGIVVNGGAGNLNRHVRISARELARLGHLFLNRGNWDGKQLIRADWVDAATSPQVPASLPLKGAAIDGRGVYGFNWWRNGLKADGQRKWPGAPPGTFAASGFNNNDMFVVREWKMVVVRLGLDQGAREIADAVYGTFLAKIGTAIRAESPDPAG